MPELSEIIAQIQEPDASLAEDAQRHLDQLTKPQGSLGRLEDLAKELAVMRGTPELTQPVPGVAVFAGDHGAALNGVSAYPREVTAQMVLNFLAGGAGINVLARQAGAQVLVVDVGVDYDFGEQPGLLMAKVARGTKNILEEPAMSKEEATQAMLAGAQAARNLISQGCDLLIPGEMGIGNTTPSSALICAFTGIPAAQAAGRGSGLDDEGLARKVEFIDKTLARGGFDTADPLGVLADLGGLEIAAIAGYCLEAAANRVPVILDGLISTAGGYCAYKLCPPVKNYFFSGHASVEQGQKAMLDEMGLRPLVDMEMRLGEGTGAALAAGIIKAAVAIYNEMATFASAGVSDKE